MHLLRSTDEIPDIWEVTVGQVFKQADANFEDVSGGYHGIQQEIHSNVWCNYGGYDVCPEHTGNKMTRRRGGDYSKWRKPPTWDDGWFVQKE